MKRIGILCLFIFWMFTSGAGHVFSRGSDFRNIRIVSAGLSLNYNYGYIGSRSLVIPPVNSYAEIGLHEFVTAGPYVSYSKWDYPLQSRSFLNLGVRGSYHFSPMINDLLDGSIDEDQIDFYAAVLSGIEFRKYGTGEGLDRAGFRDNTRLFVGPVAGVRFYFSDDLAVFSEVGRGALGAMTVGLSVRL